MVLFLLVLKNKEEEERSCVGSEEERRHSPSNHKQPRLIREATRTRKSLISGSGVCLLGSRQTSHNKELSRSRLQSLAHKHQQQSSRSNPMKTTSSSRRHRDQHSCLGEVHSEGSPGRGAKQTQTSSTDLLKKASLCPFQLCDARTRCVTGVEPNDHETRREGFKSRIHRRAS